MITNELIKERFIVQTLIPDLDRIKADQLSRLHGVPERARRLFDIPAIRTALQGQKRTVTAANGNVVITEQVDKRIRYLDMRRLGNVRIYNKVLFPLIYRSALARIHYGFTEEVRRNIREKLTEACRIVGTIKLT
ncbi:MAG: hypothetical protein LBS79_05770 [Tannerella sp.]|jgi:hypothetical protein|nr:hypothetical protein [Tannerella sp.]